MGGLRLLTFSPHHPEFVNGGAERAAHSLFTAMKREPEVEYSALVAGAALALSNRPASFGSFRGRQDEILAAPPPVDPFTLESRDPDSLKQLISELIRHARPDVAHVHHVLSWGIELLEFLAQARVRTIVTLHDFWLMCHQHGQMVKTDGRLCSAESPLECHLCFPAWPPGKFFIRRTLIQKVLECVDRFVAPSRFLADRYIGWGIPAARIEVIDNLSNPDLSSAERLAPLRAGPVVFGYFGQWNPYKGVDVLLEACTLLDADLRDQVEVRLYGENRYWRGGEFEERIGALLQTGQSFVQVLGPYRNDKVMSLMQGCDYVVVPSIWWENSPLVIQEAKLAGRRVLSSDIGGMAEKLDPHLDKSFPAGSPAGLANAMREAVRGSPRADQRALMARAAAVRAAEAANIRAHLQLYVGEGERFEAPCPDGQGRLLQSNQAAVIRRA